MTSTLLLEIEFQNTVRFSAHIFLDSNVRNVHRPVYGPSDIRIYRPVRYIFQVIGFFLRPEFMDPVTPSSGVIKVYVGRFIFRDG